MQSIEDLTSRAMVWVQRGGGEGAACRFCSLKHRISELARAFGKTRCKLSCDEHKHIVINLKPWCMKVAKAKDDQDK